MAWNPSLNNNSMIDINAVKKPLTWMAGDGATEHDVYFGPTKLQVSDADASDTTGIYQGRQGTASYTLPAGSVEWGGGPYYWRVDEVNAEGSISTGATWSFSVADYLIVDEFESYNGLNEDELGSNRIYLAWKDGFNNPTTNGSVVGHALPPYTERTIVHDGRNSMPFSYNNSAGKSEATLTLTTTRDWTFNGVNTLTIWFRGSSDNAAEPMYVVLNGNAGITNDNPNSAQASNWTEWNINLQTFADQGVDLTNVNTITLGFGDRNNPQPGGKGLVFFDDIRLYPPPP